MSINILKRSLLIISLIVSGLSAQEKVDAIEAARQAKAAAEKAAADAEAATDAAIEQAAKNAAKDAREKIKQDRLDEEARKIAEAAAAEEAELDAAATAAAEEAKRKMAEELGLEYTAPGSEDDLTEEVMDESTVSGEVVEEVVAKEALGWSVGAAFSAGLVKGATFTSVPTGGTVVITTPYSFKVGPFDYTVSLGAGGYVGEHDETSFNPTFAGLGGNLTVAEMVFAEGHVGLVGEGTGFRGFAGVSLERLMKKGLDLPFNVLVGSEAFFSTDMAGAGNSSYWAALGVRLDYSF
jgi:hypothetical protein